MHLTEGTVGGMDIDNKAALAYVDNLSLAISRITSRDFHEAARIAQAVAESIEETLASDDKGKRSRGLSKREIEG